MCCASTLKTTTNVKNKQNSKTKKQKHNVQSRALQQHVSSVYLGGDMDCTDQWRFQKWRIRGPWQSGRMVQKQTTKHPGWNSKDKKESNIQRKRAMSLRLWSFRVRLVHTDGSFLKLKSFYAKRKRNNCQLMITRLMMGNSVRLSGSRHRVGYVLFGINWCLCKRTCNRLA